MNTEKKISSSKQCPLRSVKKFINCDEDLTYKFHYQECSIEYKKICSVRHSKHTRPQNWNTDLYLTIYQSVSQSVSQWNA